jgi:hypothetical protein
MRTCALSMLVTGARQWQETNVPSGPSGPSARSSSSVGSASMSLVTLSARPTSRAVAAMQSHLLQRRRFAIAVLAVLALLSGTALGAAADEETSVTAETAPSHKRPSSGDNQDAPAMALRQYDAELQKELDGLDSEVRGRLQVQRNVKRLAECEQKLHPLRLST